MQCDAVVETERSEIGALDRQFFDYLYAESDSREKMPDGEKASIAEWMELSRTSVKLTQPIVELFKALKQAKESYGVSPDEIGLDRDELVLMARKHQQIDEHHVSIGGRVMISHEIVKSADARVEEYLRIRSKLAPTGTELWDQMLENKARIMKALKMSDKEWDSYGGQIKHAITSVEQLASILDVPQKLIEDIQRVSKVFRMRISPYYASRSG